MFHCRPILKISWKSVHAFVRNVAKALFTKGYALRATFQLPKPKYDHDAQWSPNPRETCFCVIVPVTLVPPLKKNLYLKTGWGGTTIRMKQAERRQNHRHGCPKDRHDHRMEAQWSFQLAQLAIVQCTLFEAQRWYRGGTKEAKVSPRLRDWAMQQNAITTWRPLANHCASILQPRQYRCAPSASFERPLSDQSHQRPFFDCCECVQNLKATMASMAIVERPVYHHWTTKATMLPPLGPQRWPDQFYGRRRRAQRSQALCKWG